MGDFDYPDYNLGGYADQLEVDWDDLGPEGDDSVSLDPADVAFEYLFGGDPEDRIERELNEWLERVAEGGSL